MPSVQELIDQLSPNAEFILASGLIAGSPMFWVYPNIDTVGFIYQHSPGVDINDNKLVNVELNYVAMPAEHDALVLITVQSIENPLLKLEMWDFLSNCYRDLRYAISTGRFGITCAPLDRDEHLLENQPIHKLNYMGVSDAGLTSRAGGLDLIIAETGFVPGEVYRSDVGEDVDLDDEGKVVPV